LFFKKNFIHNNCSASLVNKKLHDKNNYLIQLPSSIQPIHKDDLIRVGSTNDGGYILTRELIQRTKFILSFGISMNWNFEKDFQERKTEKIKIHAYDHTIGLHSFRNYTIFAIIRAILTPLRKENWKNIFKYFSYKKFFDGTNNIHFQERVWWSNDNNSSSFEKILERIDDENIFLKMDIELSEYRVINKILENHQKIVGMVIEFHAIDILYDVFFNIMENIKEKFNIIHIHGNNFGDIGPRKIPNTLEITFENKEIAGTTTKPSNHTYPIKGIDQPNNPKESDFTFTFNVS